MTTVKLIVAYPQPTDAEAFEKVYKDEHVPLAVARLDGKTRFVATKIKASPEGTPVFYGVAEVHFLPWPLSTCAGSPGGKEVLRNAVKISSGGPPIIMIREEESFTF
jgi:uncharacterized protein (TIGR02118 family)